jgi:hypothetical protein
MKTKSPLDNENLFNAGRQMDDLFEYFNEVFSPLHTLLNEDKKKLK